MPADRRPRVGIAAVASAGGAPAAGPPDLRLGNAGHRYAAGSGPIQSGRPGSAGTSPRVLLTC
jgi:hypothetical protein